MNDEIITFLLTRLCEIGLLIIAGVWSIAAERFAIDRIISRTKEILIEELTSYYRDRAVTRYEVEKREWKVLLVNRCLMVGFLLIGFVVKCLGEYSINEKNFQSAYELLVTANFFVFAAFVILKWEDKGLAYEKYKLILDKW